MKRSLLVVLSIGVFALLTTTSLGAATFPRTIVPWHKIGGIAIGMQRQSVIYRYGYGHSSPYADADYKTPDGKSLSVTYGTKASGFVGRVIELETDSSWFITTGGIGVEAIIPLTPCKTIQGNCVHYWNGFTLGQDPTTGAVAWRKYDHYGGRKIMVELLVSERTIRGVILGACGPAWVCPSNLANG
jgi:hypothetical protein